MKLKDMKVEGLMVYFTTDDEFEGQHEYRTNALGEGLWKWNEGTASWKQIAGTCQFSLHQKTRSGRWKAIKRYFES